jgi:hypothetical protein
MEERSMRSEYNTRNKGGKKMKKSITIWMPVLLSLFLAMPAMVSAEGKHSGTVLRTESPLAIESGQEIIDAVRRKYEHSTVSKTGGKSCMIDLTAPKDKGHCELGPNDPPAKLVVKGWYVVTRWGPTLNGYQLEYTDLNELSVRLKKSPFEYISEIDVDSDDPMDFWYAKPANKEYPVDKELFVEEGETVKWRLQEGQTEEQMPVIPVYTKEELSTAMRTVQKWSKLWKQSH